MSTNLLANGIRLQGPISRFQCLVVREYYLHLPYMRTYIAFLALKRHYSHPAYTPSGFSLNKASPAEEEPS